MRARVRNIVGLMLLVAVMLVGPFLLARHMLSLSRDEAVVADQPNYLAHQPPPKKVKMTPKLASLLRDDLRPVSAIPRVFLSRLPENLTAVRDAKRKKRLFTSALLPIVLRANELIIADRGRLFELRAKLENQLPLRRAERQWLSDKARQYRIKRRSNFRTQDIDILMYRVDIIPPSLALAQAAMETGWGTSRFAQAGNALFGEWVWGEGDGLMPLNRDEGKTHKIKKFEYLLDSVASYMTNLNRHPSYEDLRRRRAELRELNIPITGAALAPSLVSYSERGADYVSGILSIINYNDLDGLDSARLVAHVS